MRTFGQFADSSAETGKSYFTTRQGISLGISKSEVLARSGRPGSDTLVDHVEMLGWDYQGDQMLAETGEKPDGRIAKDSFGYHVIMYFRNGSLVAMILENDIP